LNKDVPVPPEILNFKNFKKTRKTMLERLSRSESRRMRGDLESAIEYLPGLASLALWCRFADSDEKTIAYTDGSTIYAGADYENFNPKERRFICLHEILHIALCHPQRANTLEKRDASFNPQLLNIAADAIINKSLENLTGLETPLDAWTLERIWQTLEKSEDAEKNNGAAASNSASTCYSFGAATNARKIAHLTKVEFTSVARWSCEELYYFLKGQSQTRTGFLEILVVAYEKDSLHGDLRRMRGANESEDWRKQKNRGRRAIAVKVDETGAAEEKRNWRQRLTLLRGTMPELFQRLAGELPEVETPWEQILSALVQTTFQEATKTNYSRPSRRWLALERDYWTRAGVSLPFAPDATKKRGARLAVALDTSGSIDAELLNRFLAEIAALLEFNQRNLVLIIGDAKVHQVAEIDWTDAARELSEIKYVGGGGTDFRPLVEAAAEYEPDALVYLTDLYGETGSEPDFPVIWATHGICGKADWGEQIKLK
jgi:predicted metal-dependent peptidase